LGRGKTGEHEENPLGVSGGEPTTNSTHVRELINGTQEGDGNEDVFEFFKH